MGRREVLGGLGTPHGAGGMSWATRRAGWVSALAEIMAFIRYGVDETAESSAVGTEGRPQEAAGRRQRLPAGKRSLWAPARLAPGS